MDKLTKSGAIAAYNVVTGVAAVKLDGGIARPGCLSGVLVAAPVANGAAIFIGGADVTVASGIELAAGQRQHFPCSPDHLWVISAAPQNARVMVL